MARIANSGTPTTVGGTDKQHGAEIEFRSVSKAFTLETGKRVEAVRDISLRIGAGEFVCVIGPSGHGKSTLINLLAGFLAPSEGKVLVAGKEIKGPGRDRGVVFQRDTLFLWRRVIRNITYGLEVAGVPRNERREVAEHYLSLIGLEGFGRAWPKQLSGGMRRRVALASVLANRPAVLLMDEPFTGLDYALRASLYDVLLHLWEEVRCTVFCVTHDVDEALLLADRIMVVKNGSLVYTGSVSGTRPRGVESITSGRNSQVRKEIMQRMLEN